MFIGPIESRARKVVSIAKEWSNGYTRWPVGWVVLECGHTGKLELRDDMKSAHDPANQVTQIGDELRCDRCAIQERNLERVRAEGRGKISHTRFRHRDSRGFGPGDLYVYEIDRASPTGCHLWLVLDDTPEAYELLREVSTSPISPTERR